MAQLDLQLAAVVRALDDGDDALLADVLLFPELLCLDSKLHRLRGTLKDAVAKVLEGVPAFQLYRRVLAEQPRPGEVTLTLDPPRRLVAWAEPVELRFHTLRWRHGEEAHVAYVPALGIEVVAAREDELLKRLPEHVRFALRRTKVAGSLHRLALTQRVREVSVEPMELLATVKDPKQLAREAEQEQEPARPVIDEVGIDLTRHALTPAYEMEATVDRLADALTGRSPGSVLLVGPAGAGKTAAVYELVRSRAEFQLASTPFWSTSGSRLVAGMSGFGMWQQRCQRLVREASKARAVVHLGNLVELIEVGRGGAGGQGIAGFLRPAVGRGELLAVAECTPEQLPVIERQDPHLLQVFHQIKVEEPGPEVGRMILLSAALALGGGKELPLIDAALDVLDRLHRRYATYSAYPGRLLRFLRNLLRDRDDRMAKWVETGDVTFLRQRAEPVTPGEVTAAFARETGLPLFMLEESAPLDLSAARAWFAARVIGQPEAVGLVTDLLATVKAGLNRPRRPIASLLLTGPTGVGKTEMAKSLAEFFFSDRGRVTRFDMSEFNSPGAVERLAGGVFGTEGLLTARVREQPFAVILLDEFEKADPSFFDLLLQVLGEGRLTDAAGRVADFSNAVVVMTSNLGAESFQQGRFGLGRSDGPAADARRHFTEAVRDFLRPELFNRIDRVVPFLPLDEATVLSIARRELDLIAARDGVRLRGVELNVSEEAVRHLAARGYDVRYGARPLKRAVERELLVPLADAINGYAEQIKLSAAVGVAGGRLDVAVRARTDAATGRQVSALASGSAWAETATRCAELRRAVQQMEKSPAVLEMNNEVFSLERMRKWRAAHPRHRHAPPDPRQADRLKRLRAVADALAGLAKRAVELEDAALAAVYEERPGDPAAVSDRTAVLWDDHARLVLALYALRFDHPEYATLAVYCEHVRTLFRLARLYYAVALRLGAESVDVYWYEHRPKLKDRMVRQRAPRPEEFLAEARAETFGILLSITGPDVMPRLAHESGLHKFEEPSGAPAYCLVDVSERPPDAPDPKHAYKPPENVHERGHVNESLGAPRRVYNLSGATLEDHLLETKTNWAAEGLEAALADAIEQQFRRAAREAVRGEG